MALPKDYVRELRREALSKAVQGSRQDDSYEDIIKGAEQFYKFITKDD